MFKKDLTLVCANCGGGGQKIHDSWHTDRQSPKTGRDFWIVIETRPRYDVGKKANLCRPCWHSLVTAMLNEIREL